MIDVSLANQWSATRLACNLGQGGPKNRAGSGCDPPTKRLQSIKKGHTSLLCNTKLLTGPECSFTFKIKRLAFGGKTCVISM